MSTDRKYLTAEIKDNGNKIMFDVKHILLVKYNKESNSSDLFLEGIGSAVRITGDFVGLLSATPEGEEKESTEPTEVLSSEPGPSKGKEKANE